MTKNQFAQNQLKTSFSAPKHFTVTEFDPEACQYSITQAQNLFVALSDYLENVETHVTVCNKNPHDEVARAIVANDAIGRVETWVTLLQLLKDKLGEANDALQIAIDAEYHKGGVQ